MVEGIEHLEAELHFRAGNELDMLDDRRIVVLLRWSFEDVLGGVAEGKRGVILEGVGVEVPWGAG